MKLVDGKLVLTKEEHQAIKKCVETIDCTEMNCELCPFECNYGCMIVELEKAVMKKQERIKK